MKNSRMRQLQRWSATALVVVLAADATINVIAFLERKITERNWDKAIAEEVDSAKAHDGTSTVSD